LVGPAYVVLSHACKAVEVELFNIVDIGQHGELVSCVAHSSAAAEGVTFHDSMGKAGRPGAYSPRVMVG